MRKTCMAAIFLRIMRTTQCKLNIGYMFSLKKSIANSAKCKTKACAQLNEALLSKYTGTTHIHSPSTLSNYEHGAYTRICFQFWLQLLLSLQLLLALLSYHYTPSFQISVKTCYSINSFQPSTGQGHSLINLQNVYIECQEDLPPEDPSGDDVAPPLVGFTSGLVPFIEPTLNSPSFPSLTASLSVMRTSRSFVVELNFSPRSTIILPHLGTENK